ncbi:tetratricopeptide repeat protein [Catellatospora citrea]|uniref:Tetratricopeptide repeat protein n=1 Tax=Catellatospora citrea TaxID=53366 RepID=A0A8J3KJV0_9ACTN|nr:tetratricopeptide repeat protein [Catellatospora citrea]RKE10706.1 hypothetical protein C8E86_5622 [Catellatospora citrea]GIG01162.1 hypothetical protein Cci01nite_62550 [Catellatospora citrea]
MSFSEKVHLAFRRGETEAVVTMSRAEIERAQALGDADGEVFARYSLARVALRQGDLRAAADYAHQGLAVALRSGDRGLEERPRHVLAAVARMSGDLARARELYRENIALNEALEQPKGVHSEYHDLAFCELGLGNLEAAKVLFACCREGVFQHGWDDLVPYVCVADAALASAEGDHVRAARMIGAAESAFAALGQVPDPDDAADLALLREATLGVLGAPEFAEQCAKGWLLDPRTAFDD